MLGSIVVWALALQSGHDLGLGEAGESLQVAQHLETVGRPQRILQHLHLDLADALPPLSVERGARVVDGTILRCKRGLEERDAS
eukprot:scaffold101672_cov90-Phaeocystis_antarctica.AAC.2